MCMLPHDPAGSTDDNADTMSACGCQNVLESQQKKALSPRDIQRRVAALEREHLAVRRDHVAIHLYLSELNKELARIDAEFIALAKTVGISARKRSGESSEEFQKRIQAQIAEAKRAFDAHVDEQVRLVEAAGISIKRWPGQTQSELIKETGAALVDFIESKKNTTQ